MSIRARLASATALVLVGVLATVSPARADDGRLLVDVPGDGQGFVHATSAPLLHFDRLAPGSSTSGTLELRNATAGPVSLDLATTDVAQSENGCLPQEVRGGDTTCRGGAGELLDSLEMTVTDLTDGRDATLWSGAMADLETSKRLLDRLAAGRTLTVRLTVTMLRGAGNDTSTDSVSFGLRWHASGDRGAADAEVLGVSALAQGSGTPGTSASGDLASQGLGGGVPLWLVIADVLLTLGLAGLLCDRAAFALAKRRRGDDRELERS